MVRTCCMETLNAASLTPVSVLSDRRTEPRKIPSFPSTPQLKLNKLSKPTSFNPPPPTFPQVLSTGGVVFLSSVLTGLAKALTYEEALGLGESVSNSASESVSDIDVGGFVDSVISFGTENPAVVIGGVTILAVPLVLSQIFKKSKPWGVETAKNAYSKLGEGDAQLLDIRAPGEIREVGGPDVRGLKKKAVSVVYKGDDKSGFLKKLSLKFKEPENTTLFIIDKFDGNSELVAELATANGFKAAYAIKDGAEGPRGWKNSGLPWIAPKKTLSLDFGSLSETFSDVLGEDSALPVALGIVAAGGLSALAFTEVETILQLLGSAALVQLLAKKLLYAEDRKQTLKEVDEFLNTKIAPKDLVDEIKQIGIALLPVTLEKKALPAATTAPEAGLTDTEPKVEQEVKAAAEPVEVNSIPQAEVKAESLPGLLYTLSPYPQYPDLKPPSSPSPSKPVPEVKTAAEPPQEVKAEAEPPQEVLAAAEPAEVNSTPKAEVKAESPAGLPYTLSPFPHYPDFKPPTSPSPSKP